MTDAEKWIYLAGLIDGEGCICGYVSNAQSANFVRVTVTNTDPRLMRWLIENFGGTVAKKTVRSVKHSQGYDWIVASKDITKVLNGILPYLVIKAEQAKLGIEMRELIGKPGLKKSQLIYDLRQVLSEKISRLNQQEWPVAETKFEDLVMSEDAIVRSYTTN